METLIPILTYFHSPTEPTTRMTKTTTLTTTKTKTNTKCTQAFRPKQTGGQIYIHEWNVLTLSHVLYRPNTQARAHTTDVPRGCQRTHKSKACTCPRGNALSLPPSCRRCGHQPPTLQQLLFPCAALSPRATAGGTSPAGRCCDRRHRRHPGFAVYLGDVFQACLALHFLPAHLHKYAQYRRTGTCHFSTREVEQTLAFLC